MKSWVKSGNALIWCMSKGTIASVKPTTSVEQTVSVKEQLLVILENKDTRWEDLEAMSSGEVVTAEDLEQLCANNDELADYIDNTMYEDTWIKVDADNDGVDDLFFQKYGGSCGECEYDLFIRDGNNRYHLTETSYGMYDSCYFISIDDNNYLVETTLDTYRKENNGIVVSQYEAGMRNPECIEITIVGTTDIDQCSIGTETLVNGDYTALQDSIKVHLGELLQENSTSLGDAQQTEGETIICDINNDGNPDTYQVGINYTSTSYGKDCIVFQTENSELEQCINSEILYCEQGTPMAMWTDNTPQGNVTVVAYAVGLCDYNVVTYEIEDTLVTKLFTMTIEVPETIE